MKPDLPLCWIGTTLRSRDEGPYHLTRTEAVDVRGAKATCGGVPIEVTSLTVTRAACGAHPWAYSGSFLDGGDHPPVSSRCQKCEALAEMHRPIFCACPECGLLESLVNRIQMVDDSIFCPRCGRSRLRDFRPVPR